MITKQPKKFSKGTTDKRSSRWIAAAVKNQINREIVPLKDSDKAAEKTRIPTREHGPNRGKILTGIASNRTSLITLPLPQAKPTVPPLFYTRLTMFWPLILIIVIMVIIGAWYKTLLIKTDAYISRGEYKAAQEVYSVLQPIPLWFVREKMTSLSTLLESSESFMQASALYADTQYEDALSVYRKVVPEDIHFAEAQTKITAITRLLIFEETQNEIEKEQRNRPAEPEPPIVPDLPSPFDEQPSGDDENYEEIPVETPPAEEIPPTEPISTDQGRLYGIQFYDCSNASSADYAKVNENQVKTVYDTIAFIKFPVSIARNAIVIFNTPLEYYSTRSSHTIKVDGKNYTIPLLDPEQYKYSLSWVSDGRLFLDLDYVYAGSDLAAIISFELAHILEDQGRVSDTQMAEWVALRNIPDSLMTDWNRPSEDIDKWEASPREDFAECFKYILGDNKGGDMWKIKTKYGLPSSAANIWMKNYQTGLGSI